MQYFPVVLFDTLLKVHSEFWSFWMRVATKGVPI